GGARHALSLHDALPICQDHQALDVVLELTNVARPVVRLQHGERVVADTSRPNTGLAGDLAHETVDQERYILAPLGERRHKDRHEDRKSTRLNSSHVKIS